MRASDNVANFAVEMKSKSQILILLLATMMIAYFGAGQLVMHCSMADTTEAVGSNRAHDCCGKKPMKSCMTLQVKKLQPSTAQQQVKAEPAQVLPLLGAIVDAVVPTDCELPAKTVCRDVEKSPPRSYLTFIQVLLI